MSEQAGPSSITVIQARQATLAREHSAVADADRVLVETIARAHDAMRESVHRLDAIAAEIDGAVPGRQGHPLDTALGTREFQRFLVAKKREIAAIVTEVQEFDRAKSAVLKNLRAHYLNPGNRV